MLAGPKPVHLKGAPDRYKMFLPLFEMAESLERTPSADSAAAAKIQAVAHARVREYLAPVEAAIASR